MKTSGAIILITIVRILLLSGINLHRSSRCCHLISIIESTPLPISLGQVARRNICFIHHLPEMSGFILSICCHEFHDRLAQSLPLHLDA